MKILTVGSRFIFYFKLLNIVSIRVVHGAIVGWKAMDRDCIRSILLISNLNVSRIDGYLLFSFTVINVDQTLYIVRRQFTCPYPFSIFRILPPDCGIQRVLFRIDKVRPIAFLAVAGWNFLLLKAIRNFLLRIGGTIAILYCHCHIFRQSRVVEHIDALIGICFGSMRNCS